MSDTNLRARLMNLVDDVLSALGLCRWCTLEQGDGDNWVAVRWRVGRKPRLAKE